MQSLIRSLGGKPDDSGSVAGAIHRGWTKVKAAVAMVAAPIGAKVQAAAAKAPVKPKAATIALLDRKLLSDSTLGSLSRGAREEGGAR